MFTNFYVSIYDQEIFNLGSGLLRFFMFSFVQQLETLSKRKLKTPSLLSRGTIKSTYKLDRSELSVNINILRCLLADKC